MEMSEKVLEKVGVGCDHMETRERSQKKWSAHNAPR